jgi:hypothetical protein
VHSIEGIEEGHGTSRHLLHVEPALRKVPDRPIR